MPDAQHAPLRDYQEHGIAWLIERLAQHKAVLLCDDPGLGKTRQALTAAQILNAKRVVVVCPAGARRVWQSEIARWVPQWNERVLVIEPGYNRRTIQLRLADPSPLVLVTGYDELSRLDNHLTGYLTNVAWDLLVIDEAHYLKNPSNRTRALYGDRGADTGIQAAAARVILLTGTPIPNHAGELWQHCRTHWPWSLVLRGTRAGPDKLLSQAEFEERYTHYRDTVYGRQITGSRNQAALRETLRPVVLRRRKDEVLAELPTLQCQDIPLTDVDVTDMQTHSLTQRLEWASQHAGDDQFLQALRVPDNRLSLMRRELGECKVGPTVVWVQERMASANKLILFAWHLSVIEHLRRGLEEFNPVVITGETSPAGRATAIDLFQHRANVRLFIGQVLAAGTAITLTAASEVAIVEPSWVPGENVQAICRAHRLGQRDSVLAFFLYLPNTLDERIMRTFRRKAIEISELQGDNVNASAA